MKLRVFNIFFLFLKCDFVCGLVGHDTVWFGRRVKTFRRIMLFVPLTFLWTGGTSFCLGSVETFTTRVSFLTVMKASHLIRS